MERDNRCEKGCCEKMAKTKSHGLCLATSHNHLHFLFIHEHTCLATNHERQQPRTHKSCSRPKSKDVTLCLAVRVRPPAKMKGE